MSYLNTVPLVWGFQKSPQLADLFELSFALPSVCADRLRAGEADIGIVPVIEMARQNLDFFRGTGIACHGPVRTILLITKVPPAKIRTLATDAGSRTSVMLSRVILAEKFGADPKLVSRPPVLEEMLAEADAALIIGDAALHLDPDRLPFETFDLGAEWVAMTGLPMVFAVWSARRELIQPQWERAFLDSCRYGLTHIEDMVNAEAPARGVNPELVRRYLTEHIVFELGDRDYEGMELYLKHALRLDRTTVAVSGGGHAQ